jgi:transcriptional regulator with XRE-family HTH domain
MTQEALAKATELRQGHISRIENGEIKDVQGETLRRLARALGVTTDYLLELEDNPSDGQPTGLALVGA